MAAFGGIEQIFEKPPLPEARTFLEALSSWKHIQSMKKPGIDESSFTEIFGELHFKEPQVQPPPPSTPPSTVDHHNESLSLCTEGLGFESCDDVEETMPIDTNHHDRIISSIPVGKDGKDGKDSQSSETKNHRMFPPPISCIGRSGKPWVWFKPCREDGRFILKEIKIPTQELLHACRQDGRLKLHLVHSDDHEDLNKHSQEQEDDEDQQEHSLNAAL